MPHCLIKKTMNLRSHVKGGILSTVIVVAVLMLLIVLAVIALWDADFLLFSRSNYLRVQRANIESAITLYCNHPEVVEQDSMIVLFDSVPGSQVKITRKPWGLYEVVTVEAGVGKVWRSAICGVRQPYRDDCALWYRNNNGAVTLTGRSHIEGAAFMPDNGVIYGQMQSTFFSGERLHPNDIHKSEEKMPTPSETATAAISRLFELTGTAGEPLPDSLAVSFRGGEPQIIATEEVYDSYLSGQIIVMGTKVEIGAGAELHDVIVVADEIMVGDGFRGSAQLFARDSVIVGADVLLDAPSGIYSKKYAELGDRSELNGYMIVEYGDEEEIMRPSCRKSRTSRLRGLFYCSGIVQFQGITSGCAFIDKSVYYSPHGYYSDFLYDVAILANSKTTYPLWFDAPPKRKEAKWVH